jgi:hypothetical protein
VNNGRFRRKAGTPSLTMNNFNNRNVMNEIIYAYTRKQAIADGYQVDASSVAAKAGIRFPVYLTRPVFEARVAVPPGVIGQDEAGRLWDVVSMLRFAIGKAQQGQDRLPFSLLVRNDNRRPELAKLIAVCSARDIDDPQPAIAQDICDGIPNATKEDYLALCASPDPGCDCGFCAKADWRDE